MWDQLQEHCTTNNIIHENHHGSIPGHDCTTAVGQALDASSLAAEDRKMAAIIMLDQKVAFDVVDHSLFPIKMRLLNFHSDTLE